MIHSKFLQILAGVLFLFGSSVSVFSQDQEEANTKPKTDFSSGMSLGIKMNTYGPGIELAYAPIKQLAIRVGANYFTYKYSKVFSNLTIDANTDLNFGNAGLVVDWYFVDQFHLSAGVIYTNMKETISGSPEKPYQAGDLILQPDQIGSLTIVLEPGSRIGPYLGLGIGKAVSNNKVVTFKFEVGATYFGSPKVDLQATGMIAPTADPYYGQKEILENNVRDATIYPTVSFQVSFRIF